MTVEELYKMSVTAQSVRKISVESKVATVGNPWSLERMKQVGIVDNLSRISVPLQKGSTCEGRGTGGFAWCASIVNVWK